MCVVVVDVCGVVWCVELDMMDRKDVMEHTQHTYIHTQTHIHMPTVTTSTQYVGVCHGTYSTHIHTHT